MHEADHCVEETYKTRCVATVHATSTKTMNVDRTIHENVFKDRLMQQLLICATN
jgi:hypothetical protein